MSKFKEAVEQWSKGGSANAAIFEAEKEIESLKANYQAALDAEQIRFKQLAESQATNAKLREALSYSKKVQEFAKLVMTGAQDRELSLMEKVLWEQTINALALPNDSPALDAVVAERTKELTAEVDRWKSYGVGLQATNILNNETANREVAELRQQIAELTAQREALRQERDAAMKDAERFKAIADMWLWETINEREQHANARKLTQEAFKVAENTAIAAQGEK